MPTMRPLPGLMLLLMIAACSGSDGDSSAVDVGAEVAPGDLSEELRPVGDVTDSGGEDISEEDLAAVDAAVVEKRKRTYRFRGIGGISMGGAAFTFHARHPDEVDFVASLGGYVNFHYLQDYMARMIFGGFCDLDTLLANVDKLNDPDALPCGEYAEVTRPWEFDAGFNHWHYDDSGADWDRDTYHMVLSGLLTATGSITTYNPDHPILPPGVPLSWAEMGNNQEKCANPIIIGKPHNYNKEYNPDGEYNVITFCDGEEPIEGGDDNPDFWSLKGAYDPTFDHNLPVLFAVAVDINGNGLRDYHEPIVLNHKERFEDVGTDGCADDKEDGDGGCAGGGEGEDPNLDNYDLLENHKGTQGDALWQEGEAYEDFGLDGVDGTGDFGEGDGQYSYNPHLRFELDNDPYWWVQNADQDDIDAVDIMLDGGIRDTFHALTSNMGLYNLLKDREENTRIWHGYTEFKESLYPAMESTLLMMIYYLVDWSVPNLGKNFLVWYGNEDATEEEIADGDGKHVGTDTDIANRAAGMMLGPQFRYPDMDYSKCDKQGKIYSSTFYSKALENRITYAISLPPCYDQPEAADLTYPVVVYLPGHGITASDAIAAGLIFNLLMQAGEVPKFILVAIEGQCCRLNHENGERYCAWEKNKDTGLYDIADPECQGPHEECETLQVPGSVMTQECDGGHFFSNHLSNRYGDKSAAKYMKYEDLLLDLFEYLDDAYRTRPPQEYEISY